MNLEQVATQHIPSTAIGVTKKPALIGEGLHIFNSRIEEAIRNRDVSVLIDRAEKEVAAGAQALAVNLGPGKSMADLTPWVVDSLAEAVDVPLFLSSGVASMDTLLKKYGCRITINAVTANPAILGKYLETARRYATNLVVLLVKPGLVPAGIADRMQLASEVIGKAIDIGLPLRQLYLDPVITCRPDPFAWQISRGMPDVSSVAETISCITDLQQDIRTIVALGTGTMGLTGGKKSAVQIRLLQLLAGAGVDAVILNCLDRSLIAAANSSTCRHFELINQTGPQHLCI